MSTDLARPTPGDWDHLVVVVATSFWDGTPLLERHLAAELAKYAPVLYVEPPISFLTRFRSKEVARTRPSSGLRLVAPRLAVFSPRLPPLKDRRWVRPFTLRLLRGILRRAVASLGHPEVELLVVTSLDPVLGALDERMSVYYAKDDYVAGAELVGLPTDSLERSVGSLCRSADLVVAVSPTLAETLRSKGVVPVVIPNACDPELFSSATPPPPSAPRSVGFVGHLSDRVDVELLLELARTGAPVKVIGPVQETMTRGHFDELLAHPGVEWLGPQPYAALPRLLSDVTTCVLPYTDSAFNRASFPLKALEYLAAGRRVVGTDLPALRWLGTEHVHVATDRHDFVTAVTRSLSTPLGEEEVAARKGYAAGHTWEQRAEQFARACGLLPVGGGPA